MTHCDSSNSVPVAIIEMQDSVQELEQPLNLLDLHNKRAAIKAALNREVSVIAERLTQLIPDELVAWVSEHLFPASSFVSDIVDNGWTVCVINDPIVHGFVNTSEAVAKMELLKHALEGVLDVTIEPQKNYICIRFCLVK